MVSSQVSVLTDNYFIYSELQELNSNLEEIVEIRTAEVTQQKEELEAQRDEIEQQNSYLNNANLEISEKNKEITDSIRYAQRIQSSILPELGTIYEIFPDSFILYKPKEVLSGDFYWASETQNGEFIFVVADCTGHGVPGALMSIIGNDLLNYAVKEQNLSLPSEILDSLQKNIKIRLKQTDRYSESKDGMDISIINYNSQKSLIQFSGAMNSLFLIQDNILTEIKADRMSIGGAVHAKIAAGRKFNNHEINITEGDSFYLFSDGYPDQLGGTHTRKFMKKRFKELLVKINQFPANQQYEILEEALSVWQGEGSQNDDILVAGIKF